MQVKGNPCLMSAPYQGAPNASKIFGRRCKRDKKSTLYPPVENVGNDR